MIASVFLAVMLQQHPAIPAQVTITTAQQQVRYTVKPGDSLSAIATRVYKSADFWPVLYWANRKQIRYANLIMPGQVLAVPVRPARIPAAPAVLGPPAPAYHGGTYHGTYQPPVRHGGYQTVTYYHGGSGYQACVIARESGGNSQAWNASGHYGLYQFSGSTWDAAGGNPADFGHASVAEQNAVFQSAYAKWGTQPWTPSDGC